MLKKLSVFATCVFLQTVVNDAFPGNGAYPDETLCRKKAALWVRDPRNCSIAYHCDKYGYIAQSVTCNKSQVWSAFSFACVAEGDPRTDDCNFVLPYLLKDDPRCIIKNGNNPDPEDCSAFLSCRNGTMVARQTCGENTLYFARNDSCEFIHFAARFCKPGTIPSHIVLEEVDEVCAPYMDKRLRSPTDPCKFVHCYGGRIQMETLCPFDTQFDDEKGYCDWSNAPECAADTHWRHMTFKPRRKTTERMVRMTTRRHRYLTTPRRMPETTRNWRRATRRWPRITWARPNWLNRNA